jgi:hypothetical protein
MRGLSGAVTALILVVASVVIALIVVGFAFNLFGTFGSAGAVTPGVPAYVYTKTPPAGIPTTANAVYLLVTLNNRGPNTTITSATINSQTVTVYKVYLYNTSTSQETPINGIYIPTGQNQLVIVFTGINPNTIAGGPVNIQLTLGNDQTISIAANLVA